MAQYNRPPRVRKEAEKQDQFVSFFDRWILYFDQHRNKLFVLIGLFVLVLAGYGLYQLRLTKQYEKLASSYYQAEQADEAKALEAWKGFLALNPPRHLAEIAYLRLGGAEAKANRWREAGEYFQKAAASRSPILNPVAELAWASSLENAKDYPKAKELYQKWAASEGSPFRDQAKLGLARCLVELNQKPEAEKLLKELTAQGSDASPAIQSAALTKLLAIRVGESS